MIDSPIEKVLHGDHSQLVKLAGAAGLLSHAYFHYCEPLHPFAPIHVVVIHVIAFGSVFAYTQSNYTASALAEPSFQALKVASIAAGVYLTTLALSILLRRAFYHPLHRFDGPFGAKLSKWWGVFWTMDGRRHHKLRKLHEKYGDIVRIGPNELSIANASVLQTVYCKGWKKGRWYEASIKPKGAESLASCSLADHGARRKVWDQAFSQTSLKGFFPAIWNRAEQLLESLTERAGPGGSGTVSLDKWMGFYGYDLMGDMAFGGGFTMLQDGEDTKGYWAALKGGLKLAAWFGHIPWFALTLMHLMPPSPEQQRFIEFSFEAYGKRKDEVPKTRDIFYYLLGQGEDTKAAVKLKDDDLAADAMLIIAAGSDTASSTLAILFCLLLQQSSKDILNRLRTELDQLASEGGIQDLNRLSKILLLDGIVQETLRLFPPVISGMPRLVPKSGVNLLGKYIPGGTTIICPQYTIQRDERYWKDADTFDPDRWARDSDKTAFFPFSLGPYTCVGRSFAVLEIRAVLATLVYNFDMKLEDGFDPVRYLDDVRDDFVTGPGTLPVVITRRKV